MAQTTDPSRSASILPFAIKADTKGLKSHLQRVANVPLGDLSPEAVLEEIRTKKLVLDEDVVKVVTDTVAAWQSDPKACPNVLLTEAAAPKHGVDGELVWSLGCDPDRPAPTDDGNDFSHYSSQMVSVAKDATVATVTSPTEGEPGVNVFGAEIRARTGKPTDVKLGEGCHLDAETGQIIADMDGTLTLVGKAITISEGLHIRGNVDFETGHIESQGDIVVEGHVADLFHIICEKNVTIRKDVNAADIRAGGDVSIGGPLVNHRKGVCLAGGNVTLRLVDNSTVAARGNIYVSRQAVSSELFAGKKIDCTSGAISGGTMVGRGGLTAKVLGSAGGAHMLVIAGVDWIFRATADGVIQQAKELAAEVAHRLNSMNVLKANLKRLTHQQREQLTELEFKVDETSTKRDKLLAQVFAMKEESKKETRPTVSVIGQVHPGVELRLGNRVTKIDAPMRGPVTFAIVEVQNAPIIVAKPATGDGVPLQTGKLDDPLDKIDLPPMPPEPTTRADDTSESVN